MIEFEDNQLPEPALRDVKLGDKDLRLTDRNPRILMQDNNEKLVRSIDEMGPVDGIVMNVNPAINELVSGNQRTARFAVSYNPEVVITHRFDQPSGTGTVAYGYVEIDGERWPYREVFWDEVKHAKGVLLANQHAGNEDPLLLAERYQELLTVDPDALETLFISEDEVERLQDGWVDHAALGEEEEEPAPAKEPKTHHFSIEQLLDLRDIYASETGRGDNGFVAWLRDRDATTR
jgi:hypothetical protein